MATIALNTPPCVGCGKTSRVALTEEELARYLRGEIIQHILPSWTREQRELLISGTHPECWARMFPEEDE